MTTRGRARPIAPLFVAVLGAVAALGAASPALANPPRPANLVVVGGDGWRADNSFSLSWTAAPVSGAGSYATHYRVLDPHGTTLKNGQLSLGADWVGGLTVPAVPGAYSAEVWFEDWAGQQGPAATAHLRFDDVRPAALPTPAVPRWIGRNDLPLRVRLDRPGGALPVSGIRGYAAAIAAGPHRPACLAADRCADAETRGGIEDDVLEIAAPPEGNSYLHAVAVSGSGMRSATSSGALLRVDLTSPATRLAGAPPAWTNRAVSLTATATDGGAGMEPTGESPTPFTAIRVGDGAPAIGAGGSVRTEVVAEGAHRVAYYARDAAGNVAGGAVGNGVANPAPQTTWVRIDRTPPAAAFTNSQTPADPDLLRVRVADTLSGPDPSRGWIGVRALGSNDRFAPLPAEPAARDELRARWDSDSHPPGDYEFRAIAHDEAGNAATTSRRQNGAPMVLSNPLKTTTALRAHFHGNGPSRTVRFGRSALLGGRLAAGRGWPLGDRPVQVVERFSGGARPAARMTTVWTRADGTFSFRAEAGPSRRIAVSFAGSRTLARSSGGELSLAVRSRVRLAASSAVARVGGAPLIFRGGVSAPPGTIPPSGKSVQLQFRLPGAPWTEFRTVQTNRRGAFRYAYRFSDDDSSGVRFQFRAYAPAQDDWPYEPAGSRPVIVRGL